jgi:hypothetical protein
MGSNAGTFLFFALVLSIASGAGGGLFLPPFKSLSWFNTPTDNIGLYGSCPRKTGDGVVTYYSSWLDVQSTCENFIKDTQVSKIALMNFEAPKKATGRMEREYESSITGAMILSLLFTFFALFTDRKSNSRATFAYLGFFLQAGAIGVSVWQFWTIRENLVAQIIELGSVSFGYGLYLSGAGAICLFSGAVSAYSDRDRREDFDKWRV